MSPYRASGTAAELVPRAPWWRRALAWWRARRRLNDDSYTLAGALAEAMDAEARARAAEIARACGVSTEEALRRLETAIDEMGL